MKYKIPYYGLAQFYNNNKTNITSLIQEACSDGYFLDGTEIEELEQFIANFCQRKYAVTVGSCTDALYFSLLSLGVGKGDEVLLPSFSFIATLSAVLKTEAIPVFLDIDKDNLSLSLEEIKQKASKKTKAIIVVPLYGATQDYKEIESWCIKENIYFIEDAAQAIGTTINNRKSGSWGDISCISFDPSKIIHGFGTGGVVLTNNPDIYQRIKKIRYHGKVQDDFVELGFNSRISTAQAKLILWQLSFIDEIIHKRNLLASLYFNELKSCNFIEPFSLPNNLHHTYHKFVIKTAYRDSLKTFLHQNGIQTMIHYPKLLFDYSVLKKYSYKADNILQAKQLTRNVLSLPLYPELSEKEVLFICKTIKQFNP